MIYEGLREGLREACGVVIVNFSRKPEPNNEVK